jgi:hypothetical protein
MSPIWPSASTTWRCFTATKANTRRLSLRGPALLSLGRLSARTLPTAVWTLIANACQRTPDHFLQQSVDLHFMEFGRRLQ